jgi:hypothetical protein
MQSRVSPAGARCIARAELFAPILSAIGLNSPPDLRAILDLLRKNP